MSDINQQPVVQPGGGNPFPRLSISDFLVLTLTISVMTACASPILEDALRDPDVPRFKIGAAIALHVLVGSMLFGLIVLGRHWFRSAISLAPGHWLLLTVGPTTFYLLMSLAPAQVIGDQYFAEHRPGFETFCALVTASVCFLATGISVVGVRSAEQRRWQICLGMTAVTYFTAGLLALGRAAVPDDMARTSITSVGYIKLVGGSVGICLVLAIPVAQCMDVLTGTRRDWMHYCGAVLAWLGLVIVITPLVLRILIAWVGYFA